MKLIANCKASPSYPTANTSTISSVKIKPKTDKTIHISITKLNTLFINIIDFFSPKSLSTSIYMGISTVARVLPITANMTRGIFIAVI